MWNKAVWCLKKWQNWRHSFIDLCQYRAQNSQSNDKGGLSGFFKMLNQVQQDQWGASVTNNRRTMGLC